MLLPDKEEMLMWVEETTDTTIDSMVDNIVNNIVNNITVGMVDRMMVMPTPLITVVNSATTIGVTQQDKERIPTNVVTTRIGMVM